MIHRSDTKKGTSLGLKVFPIRLNARGNSSQPPLRAPFRLGSQGTNAPYCPRAPSLLLFLPDTSNHCVCSHLSSITTQSCPRDADPFSNWPSRLAKPWRALVCEFLVGFFTDRILTESFLLIADSTRHSRLFSFDLCFCAVLIVPRF